MEHDLREAEQIVGLCTFMLCQPCQLSQPSFTLIESINAEHRINPEIKLSGSPLCRSREWKWKPGAFHQTDQDNF